MYVQCTSMYCMYTTLHVQVHVYYSLGTPSTSSSTIPSSSNGTPSTSISGRGSPSISSSYIDKGSILHCTALHCTALHRLPTYLPTYLPTCTRACTTDKYSVFLTTSKPFPPLKSIG